MSRKGSMGSLASRLIGTDKDEIQLLDWCFIVRSDGMSGTMIECEQYHCMHKYITSSRHKS